MHVGGTTFVVDMTYAVSPVLLCSMKNVSSAQTFGTQHRNYSTPAVNKLFEAEKY